MDPFTRWYLGLVPVLMFIVSCESDVRVSTIVDDDDDITGDDNENGNDDDEPGWDDDDDDNDSTEEWDTEVCEEKDIRLVRLIPGLMILQDVSGSMVSDDDGNPVEKWAQAQAALTTLVNDYQGEINIGFDIFPDGSSSGMVKCGVDGPVVSDALQNNGLQITDELKSIEPDGNTPLYDGMNKFTDQTYAPEFINDRVNSHLLVVSDGEDSCFIDYEPFQPVEVVTPEKLAELTRKLLDEMGIKTFVIGFGEGVEPDDLNAIAENGGTEFSEYLIADDQQSLEQAMDQVAKSLMTCVYTIEHPDEDYVDLDKINFFIGSAKKENAIPHDPNCAADKGWTWRNSPENTTVEFCEKTCDRFLAEDIDQVIIQYGCPPIVIQ